MSSSAQLTVDDAITVLTPIVIDVVQTLRERQGAEPTLAQVQAELATDENRARAEAEAFYLRHPEQRPAQT